MNHHMGDLDVDVDLSRYTPEMQSEIDDAVKILNKLLIKKFSSLDRDNFGYQYVGMKNFGEAILPLLKYSNQSQSQGQGQVQQGQGQGQQSQGQGQGQQGEGEEQQGQGQGQGQGQQGEGSYLGLTPEGGSGAQVMLTPQMISQLPSSVRSALKKGLEPIVKNFNMGTYQQLKQFFFKQGQEQSGGSGGKGVGFGSIDEALANKEIRDYYKEAAKAYGTVYRPRKGMCISAEDDYLGKEQFRFNVPTHLIDVRFSGGKILPTVTHVKAKVKVPVLKKKKFLPRAIIYKDSSGSMPDPRSETCYATIAGSVIGLSYLQSGSQVGVAMFDSETSNIVNTYDPDEFLGVLCGYKGGGTAVDIEKLKEDLKSGKLDLPIDPDLDEAELKNNPYFQQILKSRGKSKYLKKNARITGYGKLDLNPATDFYIITDGGIANIKELLDFFNENEGYNPTIIHTGNYELNVEGYDQKTSGKYGKINVYKADTREDIIKMTQKATLANLRSKEQHFHSTQDNVY